jgi:hypothetical protein
LFPYLNLIYSLIVWRQNAVFLKHRTIMPTAIALLSNYTVKPDFTLLWGPHKNGIKSWKCKTRERMFLWAFDRNHTESV